MEEEKETEKLFGEVIKSRRLEIGWSLNEVSLKTGINSSYINRLEKGERRNPGATALFRLSKALELDHTFLIRFLLSEEEEKRRSDDNVG